MDESGIRTCDPPTALARRPGAVVAEATETGAVRSVAMGDDGVVSGIRRDVNVVFTIAVSREATIDVSTAVRNVGCRYIGVPVQGTIDPSEEVEILAIAGAVESVVSDVRCVLEVFRDVRHVGPVDNGISVKV